MARIRSVKPELRTSEVVAHWPFEVRYFFVLLWGYLDDKGRGLDVPKAIAGDCFPHDDRVTAKLVDKWLHVMAVPVFADKPAPICRYEVGGRKYLHTVNSGEHQRPNRPTPSRLPPCPIHDGLTESPSEPVTEQPSGDSLPGICSTVDVDGDVEHPPRSESRPRGASGPGAVTGKRLVERLIGPEFPSADRTALVIKTAELLQQFDEPTIEQALVEWRSRTGIGPGLLPSMVSDVVKRRSGHVRDRPAGAAKPSTTDTRMAGVQALKHTRPALPAGGPA